MKRRTFIRRAGGGAIGTMMVSGCRSGERAMPTLRILSWVDYFCPERLAAFAKEYGCQLEYADFASNEELYDRLLGGEQADVLVPSTYMRVKLQQKELLSPVSDGKATTDSVPYLRGVSGLAWMDGGNQADTPCSWEWIPKAAVRRLTLLDDMRETIGAALKFLGYSGNSRDEAEVREAVAVVQDWKQRIAAFESEYYKIGLVAGEYDLVHGYSGDVLQAAARNPGVKFGIPAEGALISTDELCIAARSGMKDLATAFIRFQTTPESLDAHARHTFFQPADAAHSATPPSVSDAGGFARSEEIAPLGEAIGFWTESWREIRRN